MIWGYSLLALALARSALAAYPLNFLVLGDWGGQDTPPYTQTSQLKTAAGMGAVAERIGSKFVLAIGDNFYYSGIHGDDSNDRFEATFEGAYTADSLQTDWYVLSGNHDYKGNVTAQLEYSKRSSRWKYPDYYYDDVHTFHGEDGKEYTLHIVMIDTPMLTGYWAVPEDHPSYFAQPPGPLHATDAMTQWAWIEKTLAASTADYLIVAGHYPVYSVCEHGNTAQLVQKLAPLLVKYGAHYFSGHDHCQMDIEVDGVHHMLTGMGVYCCYTAKHKQDIPQGSLNWYIAADNAHGAVGGFASVEMGASETVVTFYDETGTALYHTSLTPRNRQ